MKTRGLVSSLFALNSYRQVSGLRPKLRNLAPIVQNSKGVARQASDGYNPAAMTEIERRTVAGGTYTRVKHNSTSTHTEMIFSVFMPSTHDTSSLPVLFYLSGLTCNDQNFVTKAGAFEAAGKAGVALVIPDTSPRGAGVPGEEDNYDFGTGAGFYVDATKEPWSHNYNMYSYITKELPEFVESQFGLLVSECSGIFGHSMGGHGALVAALRNPSLFQSVSAFAPIVNPLSTAWGQKGLGGYLNDLEKEGADYDATELMRGLTGGPLFPDILLDQGGEDEFYKEGGQLQPWLFKEAARAAGQKVTLRIQPGYDHSYYFISSFVKDHIRFHAEKLIPIKQKCIAERVSAESERFAFTANPGQPITCQAMVAFAPKQPLTLCEIIVAPPKKGEVRLKVVANALCHTDVYTLNGEDPEGLFPSILGHEAGCIVESVGEGVTSVKPGDHVIPAYTPQCAQPDCIFCQSPKTNLCPAIRSTQGKGVMPDGTPRFTLKSDGSPLYHFMGCSTFSEYTVVSEWSCALIEAAAPLDEACLLGCGVSTGLGAVWNNCKVEQGSSVAVFGLGAVGLSVVQGAAMAGAAIIVGIDTNENKFEFARKMGMTASVNPRDVEGPIQQYLVKNSPTGYGFDYTFDCTGNTTVMRSAIECAHRGWGVSCVVGVAAAGQELCTRPFQLVTGRRWIGTAFGGWKSRTDIPNLVKRTLDGTLSIQPYITHRLKGVEQTNKAIEVLKEGNCLRCVVEY